MSAKPSVTKKKTKPISEKKPAARQTRPADNPDSREKQLTQLAVDLAEKQLTDGTASPSVINHFLKIASKRETLERDILEKQAKLIHSKAESISRDRDAEELAKAAIEAMKSYKPGG